jgi:hypothetical protein
LNWQGSRFLLFLLPPGVEPPNDESIPEGAYTPWNAASKGAEYVEGPTYAYYKIPNPVPGVWTLRPEGDNTPETNPEYPEPVYLSIVAAGDITLDVQLNKTNYVPGESVSIEATLSEGGKSPGGEHIFGGSPITNAAVEVKVVLPDDGGVETLILAHTGNGVYRGSFTNTSATGTYDVNVFASGTLPGTIEPFTRQFDQSIYVAPPFVPTAVLVATNSMILQDSARVVSGSAVVNGIRAGNGVELSIASGVRTPSRHRITANSIVVAAGAVLASDVYYNTLKNFGIIGGSLVQGVAFPAVTLPPFESASPGNQDLTVANGAIATLAEGNYRDIVVSPHATLILSGGTYNIRSLWVKSNASVSAEAPVRMRVRNGVMADNNATIGPSRRAAISAADIVLYVRGTNAESKYTYSVNISPKSKIAANIYAPNGTILLNQETEATGAFYAKDIIVGKSVSVTLDAAFTNVAMSASVMAATEDGTVAQAISEAIESVPTQFVVAQNYPNPFNPSTSIQFGLPDPAHVAVTIYNMLGQQVARLLDQSMTAGYHQVRWEGTTDSGIPVGGGVYVYRVTAGDKTLVRKMILLK